MGNGGVVPPKHDHSHHGREDARFRLGTWNCHASVGLHHGQLRFALNTYPGVHAWTIEEVKARQHLVAALADAGKDHEFDIVPAHDYPGNDGMVYHLIRADGRFDVDQVLTPRMPSGKYRRELLHTTLADRRTGRRIDLLGFHLDPLGRGFVKADVHARKRHEAQAQVVADEVATCPPGAVVLGAGDGNERLDAWLPVSLRPRSLKGRLAKAGVVPAHAVTAKGERAVGIDETWHRRAPYVDVVNRRRAAVPGGQPEHPIVVTTYLIDAL